jgi:hypothetical protein
VGVPRAAQGDAGLSLFAGHFFNGVFIVQACLSAFFSFLARVLRLTSCSITELLPPSCLLFLSFSFSFFSFFLPFLPSFFFPSFLLSFFPSFLPFFSFLFLKMLLFLHLLTHV